MSERVVEQPLPGVRVVYRSEQRLLQPGDRYQLPADCGDGATYEVLSVSPGSAYVRSSAVRVEVFRTADDESVEFAKRPKGFTVSRRAAVKLLEKEVKEQVEGGE